MVLAIQLAVFVSLAGLNLGNADYENYERTYDAIGSATAEAMYFDAFEFGYRAMAEFATASGLDFREFRWLLFSLSAVSFYISLRKSRVAAKVFSLYLLFPGLLDIVQLRNGVCAALTCFAFYYFYNCRSHGRFLQAYFGAFISLLAAASFQVVAYVYVMAFVVAFLLETKLRVFGYKMPLAVLAVPVVALIGSGYLSNYLEETQRLVYLLTRTSPHTVIALWAPILMCVFVIYRSQSSKPKENRITVVPMVIPLLVTLPLVVFNVEFFRITRNLIVPIFMLVLTHRIVKLRDVLMILSFTPAIVLFYFVAGLDTVLLPVFSNF